MSAVRSSSGGLRHDGMFYDDEAMLEAAAVPFVREGLEAGEIVLVNTGAHPVTGLLSAMFADEERIVVADHPGYATPAAALERYRRTMAKGLATGVTGFRAMGFIDFTGPLPWQEWLRYEAAVNRVFEDYPFRTLCPLDLTRTEPVVAAAIRRAHPGLVEPGGWRRNEEYVAPERLVVEEGLSTPPHPAQSRAPDLTFEHTTLRELRMALYEVAMFTRLARRKVDDLVAAAGEVATNAERHGGSPVRVEVWAEPEAVTCVVTDPGAGIADPFAGYIRPLNPKAGLGLWAARQLADLLDYRTVDDGFAVRVTSYA